jgi:hypothetical protein
MDNIILDLGSDVNVILRQDLGDDGPAEVDLVSYPVEISEPT